jgi:acetyl-CoA carboxylase carboxyltransferase component
MSNTKLSASDRISQLLDDSSFVEVGGYVTSRNTDFNLSDKENPADGVLTGYGTIEGNLVYVYSQDASVLGGSIGEMHAEKIVKMYDMAMKVGAPVIGLVDCAGLRLQEATDALNAFGKVFYQQSMASGVIPQITGVFGVCGGGAALIPAFSDFTFMSKESGKLFVNSPNAIAGNYEEKCDTAGAEFQAANVGNVDRVCDSDADVLAEIRQLITIIPANNEDDLSYEECTDDLNRAVALAGSEKDARAIFQAISDNNFFMELKKEFAPDMVIGLIRLNGITVGCVGNQTEVSEGLLTTKAAYVAAEFVTMCDAFNIPVLTVASAKGFKADMCEEKTIAKAAAKLTYAYANATVPKVTVIVGETFGTAYVAMNSKALGADMVYAWPTAKIGMMDATAAAKIMYDGEKDVAEKAAAYDELQSSALAAAKRGYVDDIIEPEATRKRVIAAFEMLFTKREDRPGKKHGTV